ncbi:hypothetical protein ACFW1M_08935 [Streptomyces inhibens]|uniref:hypothetical protein n=1 Tax=Streptomyces inhibens TaxID=2293571 RepID=UPI0036C832BA
MTAGLSVAPGTTTGNAALLEMFVLGQAKCVKLDTLITAEQIARDVARLRGGCSDQWIGPGSRTLEHGPEDRGGDLTACIEHILTRQKAAATNPSTGRDPVRKATARSRPACGQGAVQGETL